MQNLTRRIAFCFFAILLWCCELSGQLSSKVEELFAFQQRIGQGLVFDIIQDQQGVMWFATEFGLRSYDGTRLRYFEHIPGDSISLAGNVTRCLLEDRNGIIWVGTEYSGLSAFDPASLIFDNYKYDPTNQFSLSANNIRSLIQDDSGKIWVGTREGGLNVLDEESGLFNRYRTEDNTSPSNNINSFQKDVDGRIWMATDLGLFHYSPGGQPGHLPRSFRMPPPAGTVITHCMVDEADRLWIGTKEDGLFVAAKPYSDPIPKPLPGPGNGTEKKHIWKIFQDSRGIIWLATGAGLFYILPQDDQPQKFNLTSINRALSVTESADGVLWIATDTGVVLLSPVHKKFSFASNQRGITSFAQASDDQIWVGTTQGLFQFDIKRELLHQEFLIALPELDYFKARNIQTLFRDRNENLWISTVVGFSSAFELIQFQRSSRTLIDYSSKITSLNLHISCSIAEDSSGNILIANGNGLVIIQPEFGTWQIRRHQAQETNSLPSNHISEVLIGKNNSVWIGTKDAGLIRWEDRRAVPESSIENQWVRVIFEDSNQQLWIGTNGALNRLDHTYKSLWRLQKQDGLPENSVLNILEGPAGKIWLTTPHALLAFSPPDSSWTIYDERDGIRVKAFWEKTAFIDKAGRLYFGGDGGLIYFHPNDIKKNLFNPNVILTDLLLFNQPLRPNAQKGPLKKAINYTQKLQLPHNRNVISLHFSALSYINSDRNTYAYHLDGFDRDWQYIGNRTETTYTNLSPGDYIFEIKAANGDGVWSTEKKVLELSVLPPWYRTWWAFLLFVFGLGAVVLSVYRFQLKRQMEQAENQRLLEMDALKTEFYTSISHEFRTPLTLILGMSDQIRSSPEQWLEKGSQLIEKNGRHLLSLINQILDLSKLEARTLSVNWVHGNLVAFIGYITESFRAYAAERLVNINFSPETEIRQMDYDAEKMQTVLSNLLSNAIKYTSAGGCITVRVRTVELHQKPVVNILVEDSGAGIPAKALPFIFDRFYQCKNEHSHKGSGIGLAITKQFIELMGGSIGVESQVDQDTTFSILLPIHHDAKVKAPEDYGSLRIVPEGITPIESDPAEIMYHDHAPLILVVEDNPDVSTYLATILRSSYNIIFAGNGEEAEEKAVNAIPDLIITDLMMPKMDGFKLCRQLKKNALTSHIPIILLTARADEHSKLKGLKEGADIYLKKPFSKMELEICIGNLLESRRQLQQYYLGNVPTSEVDRSKAIHNREEHRFVERVRNLIEENLDRSDYSVEHLSKDLNMTSNQLYRKMKALTGQTTVKFYRSVQIGHARKLLTQKELTISEIAYRVGFSDPAYFSRAFTESTGTSPSAYREKNG